MADSSPDACDRQEDTNKWCSCLMKESSNVPMTTAAHCNLKKTWHSFKVHIVLMQQQFDVCHCLQWKNNAYVKWPHQIVVPTVYILCQAQHIINVLIQDSSLTWQACQVVFTDKHLADPKDVFCPLKCNRTNACRFSHLVCFAFSCALRKTGNNSNARCLQWEHCNPPMC